MNENDLAMLKVDNLLTELWINALCVTNQLSGKFIYDMENVNDWLKWHELTDKIK